MVVQRIEKLWNTIFNILNVSLISLILVFNDIVYKSRKDIVAPSDERRGGIAAFHYTLRVSAPSRWFYGIWDNSGRYSSKVI